MVPAHALADTTPSPTTGGTSTSSSSAVAPSSPEQAASQTAQATGVAQVVDALTTSTSQTMANPDGTFSLSQSLLPVRVKQDGGWVPVDLTLVMGADGLVRPNAGPSPLAFSDGGSGPLVSATGPDGRAMTVQYPSALPTPTLDGPTATYADVLPNVDLVVSATATGGFSEVFRVKTAEAGANPALKTVSLAVTTPGMAMTVDSTTNSLTATDTSGNVQFHAPTPTMWDSATPTGVTSPDPQAAPPVVSDPAQSDATGPGVQADTAPMATTLAAAPSGAPANTQTVTVHPDTTMLSNPDTVYPVYIDPYYAPTTNRMLNYTWVQQGCATTSNWDSTARSPGAGLNEYDGCKGVERTYYQMDTSSLAGDAIGSATLQTTVNYSAQYCPGSAWSFVVAYTNPISSATTWNNQPTLAAGYPSSSQSISHCQGQGNVNAAFDVTSAIRGAATNSWPNANFRLEGDEGNDLGFKRFDPNPVLNVTYDQPPNQPTALSMRPAPTNGFLGRSNAASGLTLSANISSPVAKQSIYGVFTVTDTTTHTVIYKQNSATIAQSGTVSVAVPSNVMIDGHTLSWTVVADDDILTSPAATGPGATLDTTPPNTPAATSTDFPAVGSTPAGGSAAVRYAGQAGQISLTAKDAGTSPSGIARIDWQLNTALSVGIPATSANSGSIAVTGGPASTSSVLTVTPNDWGTNVLYVRTVDRAGNYSQNATYYFYVRSNPSTNPDGGRITGITNSDDMATVTLGSPPAAGTTGPDESTCDVLKIDPVSASDPAQAAAAAPTSTSPSAPPVPYEAAHCTDAPNKTSWAGSLIAHTGSLSGQAYDDLVVWQGGGMHTYTNGGYRHLLPTGFFNRAGGLDVQHPNVVLPAPATPITGVADWSSLTSMAIVPDANGNADLVTVENLTGTPRVYLYPAAPAGATFTDGSDITPTGMSAAQVASLDLMSPGQPVGSTTVTPKLWMRDGTSGAIYQMSSSSTRSTVDPTTVSKVAGAGTFSPSTFPSATMIGTYHNGIPEIITGNTVGQLARQQLTSTTPPASGSSPFTTANLTRPWFLSGSASAESLTNQTPADYVPLAAPVRKIDTRSGLGGQGKLNPGVPVTFDISSVLPQPQLVTAVAVNAVLLNATEGTFVRFGPNGSGDATSSIDANANTVTSGSAVVPVDATGHITAILGGGQADLIIDISGYFTTDLTGTQSTNPNPPSVFLHTTTTRVCDSRTSGSSASGCVVLPPSGATTIGLGTQQAYVDAQNAGGMVTAVALNLTAPNWSTSGSLTAWASGAQPGTSVLNPLAGQAVATSTIVGLDSTGSFKLAASGGGNIIIDVIGYYVTDTTSNGTPITGATRFVTLPGSRILRTDTGLNTPGGNFVVAGSSTLTFTAAGATDNLGTQVTPATSSSTPQLCSALLNVESFNPSSSGYLGVQPLGSSEQALTVNYDSSGTKANTFIARTDAAGLLQVTNNSSGPANIAVDVTGYYAPIPAAAGGSGQCAVVN